MAERRPVFGLLLVGLDGSVGADAALDAAITLGRPGGATILLAAITDIRLLEAPLFDTAGPLWTEGVPVAPVAADLRTSLDERARRLLEEGAAKVTAAGLAAETVHSVGVVDEELSRLAEEADAIVIGRRGELHTRPGKIGAVTAHVIKRGVLPVVVAGDAPSTFARPVVAVDGGETSARALDHAAGFALERGLDLDVVYVCEDEAAGETELARARAAAEGRGVTARTHRLTGEVVGAVAEFVARSKADLLVVGAHGGRGTAWPLGSHAERLIRATIVPVVVHH